MAYVITEPCVGTCSAQCAQVCPVFCIQGPLHREGEGKERAELENVDGMQLYIDPQQCIDCGHCVSECPTQAIYPDHDIPPQWQHYLQKNKDFFDPNASPTPTEQSTNTPTTSHSRAYGPTISIHSPVDIDHQENLPVWEGQKTPLTVIDIVEETKDSRTFRFQGRPLCRFVYKTGQFCTLVLNIDGKKVLRSYTISSTPSRPFTLEITVKRVPGGLVSNWLIDELNVGDIVEIAGPKGKFCLHPGKIPQKILFISAGSGVTPMMAMSRWIYDVGAEVDIKFFNSVRTPEDIIFRKELEFLTSSCRAFSPIITTTSRENTSEWMGFRGRVTREMLEFAAPDIHERHIYMCGPGPFMDAVKEILNQMNFDKANLHMESFGGVRTSKKNKSTPKTAIHLSADLPQTNQPQAGGIEVSFSKSGKSALTNGSISLLELAEEHDIDIDYSCRSGSCGECMVRLLEGEVDQEADDALSDEEKAQGYVLTCVSNPKTKCLLDA